MKYYQTKKDFNNCNDVHSKFVILTEKILSQGFFLVKLKSALRQFYGRHTNDHEYIPLVVSTSRSFTHSWLITGFVTSFTRRVPLVEQELPTLPEPLSSPPVFSGVRVARSLVLCVCFVDRCLYFFFWPLCCLFDLRILITSLWYLQTLLARMVDERVNYTGLIIYFKCIKMYSCV